MGRGAGGVEQRERYGGRSWRWHSRQRDETFTHSNHCSSSLLTATLHSERFGHERAAQAFHRVLHWNVFLQCCQLVFTLWHLVAPYYKQHWNEAMPSPHCGTWGIFDIISANGLFLIFCSLVKSTITVEKDFAFFCACGFKTWRIDMLFIGWKKNRYNLIYFEVLSVASLSQILSHRNRFACNYIKCWHRLILNNLLTPISMNRLIQHRCKAAPPVGESATVSEWQRDRLGWQGTVGTRAEGQADWGSLPCVPALQPAEACASVTPTGREHTTTK